MFECRTSAADQSGRIQSAGPRPSSQGGQEGGAQRQRPRLPHPACPVSPRLPRPSCPPRPSASLARPLTRQAVPSTASVLPRAATHGARHRKCSVTMLKELTNVGASVKDDGPRAKSPNEHERARPTQPTNPVRRGPGDPRPWLVFLLSTSRGAASMRLGWGRLAGGEGGGGARGGQVRPEGTAAAPARGAGRAPRSGGNFPRKKASLCYGKLDRPQW